jgi:hypothetical protein
MNYYINKKISSRVYKFLDSNIYICCFYDGTMFNMQRIIIMSEVFISELSINSCDCSLDNGSIIIEFTNSPNMIFYYKDDNSLGVFNNKIIYQVNNYIKY